MKRSAISQLLAIVIVVAIILAAFAGYAFSSFTSVPVTVTVSSLVQTTVTVTISSNSSIHFTTITRDCSGVPVCGITSAASYTDNTTTVVLFVYPTYGTTSTYTLTLTHETSPTSTNT